MPNRIIREIIAGKPLLVAAPEQNVRDAARHMCEHRVGALLVVQQGKVVGIFTERDALNRVIAKGLDPATTSLATVMTSHPECIDAGQPLRNALLRMHEGGFRHMPVLDDGVPAGMVSVRDAISGDISELEKSLKRFEEIAEAM